MAKPDTEARHGLPAGAKDESAQPHGEASRRPHTLTAGPPAAPADQAASDDAEPDDTDADWGQDEVRRGPSRETILGVSLILVLLCAFSFVVYKKWDSRGADVRISDQSAELATASEESTAASQQTLVRQALPTESASVHSRTSDDLNQRQSAADPFAQPVARASDSTPPFEGVLEQPASATLDEAFLQSDSVPPGRDTLAAQQFNRSATAAAPPAQFEPDFEPQPNPAAAPSTDPFAHAAPSGPTPVADAATDAASPAAATATLAPQPAVAADPFAAGSPTGSGAAAPGTASVPNALANAPADWEIVRSKSTNTAVIVPPAPESFAPAPGHFTPPPAPAVSPADSPEAQVGIAQSEPAPVQLDQFMRPVEQADATATPEGNGPEPVAGVLPEPQPASIVQGIPANAQRRLPAASDDWFIDPSASTSPAASMPPSSPIPPSSNLPDLVARTPAHAYEVRANDNFWTISRSQYGTARYFVALARFNAHRIPDATLMRPGMKVLIPQRQVLEASYPDLFAGLHSASPAAKGPAGFFVGPSGEPMYRVDSNDTLGEVARKHLGRTSRWTQIYEMNRDVLSSPDALKIGVTLKLPADASRVRIVENPRDFN